VLFGQMTDAVPAREIPGIVDKNPERCQITQEDLDPLFCNSASFFGLHKRIHGFERPMASDQKLVTSTYLIEQLFCERGLLIVETPGDRDRCIRNQRRHLVFAAFVDQILDLESAESHTFTRFA